MGDNAGIILDQNAGRISRSANREILNFMLKRFNKRNMLIDLQYTCIGEA